MSAEIRDIEVRSGCRMVQGPAGFEIYRLEDGALRPKGTVRTRPQAIAFMEGVLSMVPEKEKPEAKPGG